MCTRQSIKDGYGSPRIKDTRLWGKNHDFDLPDFRVAEKEKQKSQNGDALSLFYLFSLA